MRESVADHSRYPGACRTLERFVGDVAAEDIFCLVESVSDAHDVATPPLSSSTQADLASIDNVAFGSLADMAPSNRDRRFTPQSRHQLSPRLMRSLW